MKRRALLAAPLGAAALAGARAAPARAQGAGRVFRLAHLANAQTSETGTRAVTLPELARLGFAEGHNLVFDARVGDADSLPRLMQELLGRRPDAILAVGAAIAVAGAATRAVPIVTFGADPVALGLARSYARPGGNVTGVVILTVELDVKRLELLQQAVPGRRRVAALLSSTRPVSSEAEMRAASAQAGIELLPFAVASPADYPAAFAAMRAAKAEALAIGAASEFDRDAGILAALALEARLPTVCEWARNARDGCLISYGPNSAALRRRVADQVARIFRGAAPGEIPIEQPTLFEFAVNLKVARALGLELPAAVLARADEVIE